MREIRTSGLMRGSDGTDLFVSLLSTLLVKFSQSSAERKDVSGELATAISEVGMRPAL